jgi:hypothetical protein
MFVGIARGDLGMDGAMGSWEGQRQVFSVGYRPRPCTGAFEGHCHWKDHAHRPLRPPIPRDSAETRAPGSTSQVSGRREGGTGLSAGHSRLESSETIFD